MKETDSFNPPNTNPPNTNQQNTNPPNQQLETKLEVPTEAEFKEYENKHPLLGGTLSAAKHPKKWREVTTGCSTRTIILVTVASFALGLAIGKFTTHQTNALWR